MFFRSWRALFLLASMLLLVGCKARRPGHAETAVMGVIKRRITIRGSERNPVEAKDEEIEAGRKTFGQYCRVCHGLDGQNTGVPFANRMSPPVPDLKSQQVQSYSDGQLKRIIDDGIFPSGMPANRGILSDDEMWRIVLYLRHLPPKGSLGEPAVYGGSSP
jgi:mono/diheme cytochrome c family protein